MIVDTVRTPIDLADLPGIVAAGYEAAFGEACPDGARWIALAQLLVEHGRKDHNPNGPLWAVYCFNLGNQDATGASLHPSPTDSPVALFRTVPECEGSTCGRTVQHIRRSYDTPDEGAAAYWLRLADGYPRALDGMRAGDVEAFLAGLVAGRYFTGSQAQYLALVHALVHEAERRGW